MGCWNESCALSHLPIMAGEEIYAFLLLECPFEKQYSYSTGTYSPIAVVHGEYDDYGGIENIRDENILKPVIQRFLSESGFSCQGNSIDVIDFPGMFSLEESMEQSPWSRSQKFNSKTTRVFMKVSVLNDLIERFRAEYASQHNEIKHRVEEALDLFFRSDLPAICPAPENTEAYVDYMRRFSNQEKARSLFREAVRMGTSATTGCRWDVYLKEMCKPDSREILSSYFLLMLDSCAVLNHLRMAWHMPSGSGSQNGIEPLYGKFLDTCKKEFRRLKKNEEA